MSIHNSPRTILHDIREGADYILHRRGLLILYAMTALVVLTVMPTFLLTPLLVKEHFGGGVIEVAVMEAMAGVGIILGGILISVWRFPRRVVIVLVSFAVSCGTVALTALAPEDMLPLAIFWWFLSGVSFSTGNAPMTALLQAVVPNELQGRTLALLNMVFGFAAPIGFAIAGPLGEAFGVRAGFHPGRNALGSHQPACAGLQIAAGCRGGIIVSRAEMQVAVTFPTFPCLAVYLVDWLTDRLSSHSSHKLPIHLP